MPSAGVLMRESEICWKGMLHEQRQLLKIAHSSVAPQVMYFAECMKRKIPFARPKAEELSSKINKQELRCFKALRVVNPSAYAYVTLLDAL